MASNVARQQLVHRIRFRRISTLEHISTLNPFNVTLRQVYVERPDNEHFLHFLYTRLLHQLKESF